jgi:hypothetical protein
MAQFAWLAGAYPCELVEGQEWSRGGATTGLEKPPEERSAVIRDNRPRSKHGKTTRGISGANRPE